MVRVEVPDPAALLAELRAKGCPAGVDVRPAARASSLAATAGRPMTVRRAAAFAAALDALQPVVYENDALVGSLASVNGQEQPAPAVDEIGERSFTTHADHVVVDFERLLRLGLPGVRDEIAQRLEDPGLDDDSRAFVDSMRVAVEASLRLLARYGEACGEGTMSDRCARLAAGPPQSFADAVQLTWWAHHLLSVEGRYANGFGRLDQYLAPFYRADRERGSLSPEEALAWLKHLWIKIAERRFFWGGEDTANIAIGGVRPDGDDGTNEISYLCLRATRELQLTGPNLSARFHRETPESFTLECIETFRTGIGYPALFNDDVLVPALEAIGIPTPDARDYALVGCIETFLPGKQPPWADGRFNMVKCLELALGNGRDLRTGEARGPETGDPCAFETFEALLDALRTQVQHGMRLYADVYRGLNQAVPPKEFTSPFLSALMADCVARARDLNDGGTRYPSNHGAAGMGLGTLADSLAAIRQGVYREGRFTMATLLAALRADFQGHEALRAWAWERAPKFGNDDPAADDLAAWVGDAFTEAVLSERTYDGGRFLPLIAANVSNIYAGKETAATPDGRRAGEPLSDAASPTYGRDVKGPTAVICSVTRLDWTKVTGGSVINQKYHPDALATEENRRKLAALLHAFFARGGQEMQLNVVTADTLHDAMEHPDRYTDLVVRVSGFSARFATLAREVQEDILARTTHARL